VISRPRKAIGLFLLAGGVFAFGCDRRSAVLTRLPAPIVNVGVNPSRARGTSEFVRRSPKPSRRSATYAGNIPASWYPPGPGHAWKTIVVHHSAGESGCAATFDRLHRARGWDELGYHFVIGNGSNTGDGAVEVGSRWRKQKHGAHCKTASNFYNKNGIGICLVGNFENHGPSGRQMASLRKLTAFLMQRYHISPDRIQGHGEVPGTHTRCPGRRLSLSRLRRDLHGVGAVLAYSK